MSVTMNSGQEDVDAQFFASLASDELRIPRCTGCRKCTWPPQWRCGACGSWEFVWETVAKRGVVHSFARTHHAFRPESGYTVPYTSLLVSLDEAGDVRLLGLLVGPGDEVRIGAAVEGFVDREGDMPVLRWRLALQV